jgi:hypothetical protein
MSYSYSQLNKIIEIQYRKKADDNSNWFLEETLKFGKGYIKPSNYLNNVVNKIGETATSLKQSSTEIDEPLYLYI